MGMKTKVYNEGGTNQTNKALSTVCFSFFIIARLGPSASQVGAASSLQDLAQALLKVLAPTPAASADPEVPAASPAASPEASPAAGTTAVSGTSCGSCYGTCSGTCYGTCLLRHLLRNHLLHHFLQPSLKEKALHPWTQLRQSLLLMLRSAEAETQPGEISRAYSHPKVI